MFIKETHVALAQTTAFMNAAETAARAIPPAFPLDATVAVNPFLGQTNENLASAAARLARVAGVKIIRPRGDFAEKVQSGNIPTTI